MAAAYHLRRLPASDDIFGAWVGIVALTASKDRPMDTAYLVRQLARLQRAVDDLGTSDRPGVASWRDVADMQNFLQSLLERAFVTDESDHISDLKAALAEAFEAFHRDGKLRMSAKSLAAMKECLAQYTELVTTLSAFDYWGTVKHAKDRSWHLLHGRKKAGDTLIRL